MHYSFLKDLIGSPWQIEAQTLNRLYPVFRGLFNGLQIEKEDEPFNHHQYRIDALTKNEIRQWSEPEEPLDDEEPPQQEDQPKVKVVNVIPIRGVLTKHDQFCGPAGTRTLGNRLLKADADENVLGHILIVESGGGRSDAVAELTDAMEKCTKPIVAWIDGISASAAYYISCYADEVIAGRDLDFVGSIGTLIIFSGRKSRSEANSLGEIEVTIYADQAEQKNEEYEKAINEFDFKFAKDQILNPVNEKFIADVKTQRPQVLPEQLKGRVYYAQDVVGTLVDSIGPFETAVDRILELSDFKNDPQLGNNNQSIKEKREMKQFTHLNQALKVESLEATDEGVFLNEEQLQTVEDSLETNQQLVSERDAANQERDTAVQERDTANTSLQDARATIASAYDPFNAIDPTIASAETPEAKAEAVRTLLASKVAAPPVQAIGDPDDAREEEVDWETINKLPHNQSADKNL